MVCAYFVCSVHSETTGDKRMQANLPQTGFLRLGQIIGNPDAKPPIAPLIPVSKSTWWAGCAAGNYPRAVKLSPQCKAWRCGGTLER